MSLSRRDKPLLADQLANALDAAFDLGKRAVQIFGPNRGLTSNSYRAEFFRGRFHGEYMAKRQVLPLAQLDTESIALFRSLFDETPLVCALICGAAIEKALMRLLRNFCLEKSDTVEKLFHENGVLGSSHKCANIAYAFGLISKPLFTNISKIEAVRNTFAHSNVPIDFDSVETECKSLTYPPKLFKTIKPPMNWETLDPRNRFNMASAITFNQLIALAKRARHREPCKDWWSD